MVNKKCRRNQSRPTDLYAKLCCLIPTNTTANVDRATGEIAERLKTQCEKLALVTFAENIAWNIPIAESRSEHL